MSDGTDSIVKLKSHMIVEALLIAALAVYFVLAESHIVGADVAFTAIGAGLMALVTFWTLNTVGDVIEVIAARHRPGKL